mmetsp:Transcript_92345/g.145991  ORF Transcript_92345/g.145991 Transcript_92345/m.145991 type:complete len:208 (+) Transcript_92345:421-1044(+)
MRGPGGNAFNGFASPVLKFGNVCTRSQPYNKLFVPDLHGNASAASAAASIGGLGQVLGPAPLATEDGGKFSLSEGNAPNGIGFRLSMKSIQPALSSSVLTCERDGATLSVGADDSSWISSLRRRSSRSSATRCCNSRDGRPGSKLFCSSSSSTPGLCKVTSIASSTIESKASGIKLGGNHSGGNAFCSERALVCRGGAAQGSGDASK